VKAEKGKQKVLFEVKNWTGKFSDLYVLYDAHIKLAQDDVLAIVLPGNKHLCIAVSTSVDALYDGCDFFTLDYNHPLYATHGKAFKKLATLEKYVKGSDILALKDDRKPFLFVRFR
jgi:hypothetical protein